MKKSLFCFLFGTLLYMSGAYADSLTVKIMRTLPNGQGESVGTVDFEDTQYGLLIKPNLHSLPPGSHGFHIHDKPACTDEGMAAGGHLDPKNTGKHLGPFDDGHLGDLPLLCVNSNGEATTPMLAPRLKVADIENHAVMIHGGGDNYSDTPQKLGGGGARIACGVAD